MPARKFLLVIVAAFLAQFAAGQPPQQQSVEIPYKGLSYSMLSKGGVTVMVAQLNRNILEYSTVQVWISNGSRQSVHVSPQFFELHQEGTSSAMLNGMNDNEVLNDIKQRAKSKDLGELVDAYETTLFGFANEKSMGYYQHRK